jgi:adenylate cyclase
MPIRLGGTGMERKLTAILAADVVSYSRLMELDEAGTLTALKTYRQELIDPEIAGHHGRLVKLMGDGALVEFASVVDAVACAVAIQDAMTARNQDLPEDRRIEFRIGVHLGDVMIEGDDLYGDGVNVAARLEGLAEPGGICISQQALDQVETKLDLPFEDLGEQQVKNIARPVHAYQVRPGGEAPQSKKTTKRRGPRAIQMFGAASVALVIVAGFVAGWWQPWKLAVDPNPVAGVDNSAPEKLSIAVLPFDNMSGDAEQEYFADGMTEDLITDLAMVSGLLVIARNSTFAYKGQSPDVRDVARQLDVRYVVEGSVRKAGGRIRINAQLIDAETGTHIWAERYDREATDVFGLQDEVRARIVTALRVELTPTEEDRLARKLTDNAEAYDHYIRGLRQESFFTKEGNLESRRLFEKALELDPSFAAAMGRLATAYTLAAENGWGPAPGESLETARRLAEKAVATDDDLPQAHWAVARVYTRKGLFDGDRAVASLRKAIDLDPNYADGHAFLATVLVFVGRAEEALGHVETAMRLNPHFPFWYYYALGASQFMLTRYDAAIESLKKAIERNPAWTSTHSILVAAYGQLGKTDEAEWEMEELRMLGFEPTLANWRSKVQIEDPAYLARYFDGLRKAGVPE